MLGTTYGSDREAGLWSLQRRSGEKDMSACSLSGFMSRTRQRRSGADIIQSIALMHDRSNGLGGGFAAYGIYPEHPQDYAFHLMFYDPTARRHTEDLLEDRFVVRRQEALPTRATHGIADPPMLWRYFVRPKPDRQAAAKGTEEDFVVRQVVEINQRIDGAFVMSSGRNMGIFKAAGFPEDVGRFYRLEEYEAHAWIGHGRFPTNTPGWWGGAHPFGLLDLSIVHNGELSSYAANRRYLEMFGYKCTLRTDTEVLSYSFDLLVRRHGLPLHVAARVLAAPFWSDIERMPQEKQELFRALRVVYGSALMNGPFAFILGHAQGMMALNDRVKLRPLVAASQADMLYVASEESGIRAICPQPDAVWMPEAGEPVIGQYAEGSDAA